MGSADGGYEVRINGVAVGDLTAEQWRQVVERVKLNKRLHLKQAGLVGSALMRFVSSSIAAAPGIAFFAATAFAVLDPVGVNSALESSPAAAIANIGVIAVTLAVVSVGVVALFGHARFRVGNAYEAERVRLARVVVGAAADGDVYLWPKPSKTAHADGAE